MPRLKDLLHGKQFFAAEPNQTVWEVAEKMAALNVGAIPVLDGVSLKGIFSERDLMKRVILGGRDPSKTPVSEVMSTELTKADESTTVEEGMQLMRQCGCRHLPVLRGSDVVGFISMRDLMMVELERTTEELDHMRNYIQSA